jgi:hypothetical protein
MHGYAIMKSGYFAAEIVTKEIIWSTSLKYFLSDCLNKKFPSKEMCATITHTQERKKFSQLAYCFC